MKLMLRVTSLSRATSPYCFIAITVPASITASSKGIDIILSFSIAAIPNTAVINIINPHTIADTATGILILKEDFMKLENDCAHS